MAGSSITESGVLSGTPVSIRNIGTSGVIMDNVVDEILMPTGAVSWVINLHFDRIGSASTRNGVTIIGTQLVNDHAIVGLHQFLDSGTGTNDRLIAAVDTTWKALVSGTWTNKRTGLTADAKARFTNFVDLVFGVNGKEAMQSWDGGAGNFSTTNVTSAPTAYYIDNFRTRVWAGRTDANPSRVYYSSVADASGAISWTSDDSGFIDISPSDGEDLTGIKKYSGALYCFKPSAVYRIFSINESEPDPRMFTGTYSQESIVVAKDGMYWHHPSGIYKLDPGGTTPQELSRPVYDIIKNITRPNYDNVSSWHDDDHVYFSVGDISVYGLTISNCVIRWTISTQLWTVYSYAYEFRTGNTYDNGSAIVRVVGDTDGNVYTFDSGYTDNGISIKYELDLRWMMISGLRSEKKTIRTLGALHENMEGAKVSWRNGTNSRTSLQPLGQLNAQETVFSNVDIHGGRIKFTLRGESSGNTAVFQGFEMLEWLNEGYGALER